MATRSVPVWRHGEIAAKAIVDEENFEKVSEQVWYLIETGLYQKQYYAKTNVKDAKGKWHSVSMHRHILGLPPRTPMVDHIESFGTEQYTRELTPRHHQREQPKCAPRSAGKQDLSLSWSVLA